MEKRKKCIRLRPAGYAEYPSNCLRKEGLMCITGITTRNHFVFPFHKVSSPARFYGAAQVTINRNKEVLIP